jgi:outer membrane murein-binding lipoprotein Lpp
MPSTPFFYCKDCHTSFKRKLNYETHLTSTKHQNRISNKKKELFVCPICNKYFSHCSSLSRHKTKCIQVKTNINTLQKENEELRKRIEDLENNQKNATTTNTKTNNTTNNIENQTNNIININCFGNENMDYITDKVILHCMSKIYGSIPLLIEKIHFDPEHPENNNIQIPNKKLPHAKIMNGKREWEIVQRKEAIEDMMMKGYNLLDETFQENSHELADTKQKHFRNFQAKYEDGDKDTIKGIKDKVEMLVINNSRK